MEMDVTSSNTSVHEDIVYSSIPLENKYIENSTNHFTIIHIPENELPEEKRTKRSSRKQSKRRKKNSNHSRSLPRIIVKPLPPPPSEAREWVAGDSNNCNKLSTMREVLASIPGFSVKTRKRSSKKLSTAAQLQQTREGCVDLETPDSILVNTNIRALLNKHTFSLLPPLYQYKLGQLLPSVDRPSASGRLNSSSLSNEFFARACLEWQDCLSGGEFTPENQQKIKTEAEKEKSKIDPWKMKHFEPFWGEKAGKDKSSYLGSERPSLKTTIKLRPTASITSSSTVPKMKKNKSSSNSKRMRSAGAITRSSTKVGDIPDNSFNETVQFSPPLPDLLPLKHVKSQNSGFLECQMDVNFTDSPSQRVTDSMCSTHIDPLFFTENEGERLENKIDADLCMTVEEIPIKNEIEEEKPVVSNGKCIESVKRMCDGRLDHNVVKKIKYEDEVQRKDASFLITNVDISEATNYSDLERNYASDQVCPSEDNNTVIINQEHVDTNSEDSKATGSADDYDERSLSSVSSSKMNCVTNFTQEPDLIINSDSMSCENSTIEIIDKHDVKNQITYLNKTDNENSSVEELNQIRQIPVNTEIMQNVNLSEEEISFQEIECQSLDTNQENNNSDLEKHRNNEDTSKATDLVVQNFYDDHFKDAESFILETSGLSIVNSQNEEIKYSQHSGLVEISPISSYMNDNNVPTVVSMPINVNPSTPMMEVTNTSVVSCPNEDIQVCTKPKNSFITWKTENSWSNNENIITLTNLSSQEKPKYAVTPNVDTKSIDENYSYKEENKVYKEEKDPSFNIESSNSSESCQSMKETLLKHEVDPSATLVSASTVTTPSLNSSTTQITKPSGKKTKSGKDSNRSRNSNKVPPGAVNLERSYQICQAVIQNSPNRDALRGQLRPPPALLSRPPRPRVPPPTLPSHTAHPAPVLLRQIPVSVVQHNEMNENRPSNVGQYILVQRTPNVAPRASSAPPANQNTNVSVARCRSVDAEDTACVCNLRAMILCKKCGAFCHDDCIASTELCFTCLIR